MNLLPDALEQYVSDHSTPEDEVLRELSRETFLKAQMPQMLSGHIQGKFLELLARLSAPQRILEIGTFTGYSAICLARGLAPGGRLITIDINEELEPIASKYFEKAGLRPRIQSLFGDARHIIPSLDEVFDLVFIDADKVNYSTYFDLVIDKVRPGGCIVADNVLWSGKVLQDIKDKDTEAIHRFNQKLNADSRIDHFIVPLRDGLHVARKR